MRDYFKAIHGKSKKDWKKANRIPKASESLDKLWRSSRTKYPQRELGVADDSAVIITEEERAGNFHILGAPGEGKSKFIEYNIRKDIDLGNGLLLLDPSEGGDTVKNVLAYCEKAGHKKVILIDPSINQKYDRIPKLAPLKNSKQAINGIMESLEILFDADYNTMRRIRRNLSSLLTVLARKNLSVRELIYFSDYHQDKGLRAAILEDDRESSLIRNLFRSEYQFLNYFQSTVNIANDLWKEPLASMIGNPEGIDFIEAVRDGWVILVNLSPYKLTPDETKLLGVLILSQVFQAITVLFNKKWKGRYYVYIDEAGRFATPQMAELLHYRRKSGLSMVLAHHDFGQFKDKELLTAILNGSKIKMMFDIPSYDDRVKMIKELGYGGDINHLMAAYTNKDIPKQYAVIRKGKEPPVRIRIPDVQPVPPVSEDYLKFILSLPFYKSKNDRNPRIIPEDSKGDRPRKTSHNKTTRSNPLSGGGVSESVSEGSQGDSGPKKKPPLKI